MFVAERRIVERDQQLRAGERAKAAAQTAQTTDDRAEQDGRAQQDGPDGVANANRPPVGYRVLRLALIVVAAASYVVLLISRFRRGRRRGAS